MKTIAFFNQKGGVSKTVSAANTGTILAGRENKRTLMIDCDAQANLSYYLMGGLKGNDAFADTLIGGSEDRLSKVIEPVSFMWKGRKADIPLSVIRSSEKLSMFEPDDVNILKNFLYTVSDDYDYAILDCGPSKTAFNMAAIAAANYVVVPMDPQLVSLNGLGLVNSFIENTNTMSGSHTKIAGVFLTMIDSRGTIHQQVMEQFKASLGSLMFDTYIRKARAAEESYNLATPLYYYERSSAVTNDYIRLVKEIEERT